MRAATRCAAPGATLKLERIPMELLLFLVERRGLLVTREEIIEKLWGKDVFLDTDNSINTAIRKIRQALRDDPEQPRFVQTIAGKGYRFIAPIVEADEQRRLRSAGSAARILRSVAEPNPKPFRRTGAGRTDRGRTKQSGFGFLLCSSSCLRSFRRAVRSSIVTMRASGGFVSRRCHRFNSWSSTESLWLRTFFFAEPSG